VLIENLNKIRDLAKEWHQTEEGKLLHKRLGKLVWEDRKLFNKICEYCGKSYKTPFPTRSKYCERKCNLRRKYQMKKSKL